MATHNETGKRGEELAAEFLQNKGYVILEKNWRRGYLEVDLICMDKQCLVLVEVKTRADLRYGAPEEFVTRKKEKNLLDAAEKYIEIKGLENEVRFDIVSVWDMENGPEVRISHIEEAFTGMG
jgi:putative endonuclease